MTILGACWGVALTIGPIVGGSLVRLGYLWPSVALAAIAVQSALVTALCLPESLPKAGASTKGYVAVELAPVESGDGVPLSREASTATEASAPTSNGRSAQPTVDSREERGWFCQPLYVHALALYTLVSFVTFAVDEAFAMFALGTLGLSPDQIGSSAAAAGPVVLPLQILTFPALLRRYGARRMLLGCTGLLALVSACMPAAGGLVEHGREHLVWPSSVVAMVAKGALSTGAYTATYFVLNNSVLTAQRGRANGAGTLFSALAKFLGPVTGAEAYAWSLSGDVASNSWWSFVSFQIIAVACALTSLLTSALPLRIDRERAEP